MLLATVHGVFVVVIVFLFPLVALVGVLFLTIDPLAVVVLRRIWLAPTKSLLVPAELPIVAVIELVYVADLANF